MKVEFLVNTDIGDGRQIFITASEFNKAAKDEEEFNSFAFATDVFFSYYGSDRFIDRAEYDYIRKFLDKSGAVIITAVEGRYPRRIYPEVFVSNNNKLKRIDLDAVEKEGYTNGD